VGRHGERCVEILNDLWANSSRGERRDYREIGMILERFKNKTSPEGFGGKGPFPVARPGMCEKRIELDDKISHYKQLSRMITDEQTLRSLKQAVECLEADKASLHPERAR
jgi:hypothetical protein